MHKLRTRRDARPPALPNAVRRAAWSNVRERRYELELTQEEVATRAGTSHSYISKLESGDHIPTTPVLAKILAALDERLLLGVERSAAGAKEPEREFAPAPALAGS